MHVRRLSKNTGLTRKIALLAGPLILQSLSYALLGVKDTFLVSRISTEAVGAVGLTGVLFFALMLLFRSTAASSVVFVGRAHGAGDDRGVGEAQGVSSPNKYRVLELQSPTRIVVDIKH